MKDLVHYEYKMGLLLPGLFTPNSSRYKDPSENFTFYD